MIGIGKAIKKGFNKLIGRDKHHYNTPEPQAPAQPPPVNQITPEQSQEAFVNYQKKKKQKGKNSLLVNLDNNNEYNPTGLNL